MEKVVITETVQAASNDPTLPDEALRLELAKDLGIPAHSLAAGDSLLERGMDSIRLMAWLHRLRKRGHRIKLKQLYHSRHWLAGVAYWRTTPSRPPRLLTHRRPHPTILPAGQPCGIKRPLPSPRCNMLISLVVRRIRRWAVWAAICIRSLTAWD